MKNVALFGFLAAGFLLLNNKSNSPSKKLISPTQIDLGNNLIAFPRIQINDFGQKAPMIIVLHGRNSSELALQDFISKDLSARVFFIRGQIPTKSGNLYYLNRLKDNPEIVGPQIKEAGKILDNGIEILLNKYPTNKLIILGFSQGAGLALYMGSVGKADSVISLSGALPMNLYPEKAFDTNIFMWHGRKDKTVPFELADNTYKAFYNTEFNTEFEIGENNYHSVTPPVIINRFLKKALE